MSKSNPASMQPIATVPRNTFVLFYIPDAEIGERRYEMEKCHFVSGIAYGREDTAPVCVSDIVETEPDYYGGTYLTAATIHPTHWMPLPEVPAIEAKKKEKPQ